MPWQELVKVGLQKEQQYTQGVDEVQSSIDQYTKLPITREVTRQYLGGKVRELTDVINKYAGEDFSNPDVISQLTRLGEPITRDTNIINEVRFTKEGQRRTEALKALKPGQRSAANDHYFMKDYYDWANSTDIKATMSTGKEYKEYQDLSKKWLDIYKAAKEQTNKKVYDSISGEWVIHTEESGMDEQKVRDLFLGSLNASEKEQLQIDAWYDNQVKGPQASFKLYNSHYQDVKATTDNVLPQLESSLAELQDLYAKTADPETKSKMEQTRQKLQSAKIANSIAVKKLSMGYTPDTLPESEYQQLYINNYVNDLSNAYAYRQEEQTLKENPAWKTKYQESQANYRTQMNNATSIRVAQMNNENELKKESVKLKKEQTNKIAESYRKEFTPLVDGTVTNASSGFNREGVADAVASRLAAGTFANVDGQTGNTLANALARYPGGDQWKIDAVDRKAIIDAAFGGDEKLFVAAMNKLKSIGNLGTDMDKRLTVVYNSASGQDVEEGITLGALLSRENGVVDLAYIDRIYDYSSKRNDN
jgi:predicted DNA-binding ArsR family transcriptional regulator